MVFDPKASVRVAKLFIERPTNAKSSRQSARSRRDVASANQNRGRISPLAGHDVQHPMDAVTEIDIEMTGVSEHDDAATYLATLCPPGSVGGFVIKAVVGFDFRDHAPNHPPATSSTEDLPE